jgi:hypothetical protein
MLGVLLSFNSVPECWSLVSLSVVHTERHTTTTAQVDDDAMLRLMTDENATQGGNSPGAVLNEVAAVMRLIARRQRTHCLISR